jgi:purine-binding chemotaxis protein CheW
MNGETEDEVTMMCSFHVGAGLFGMDTRQICEVLGMVTTQSVPLTPQYIDGVMAYRGEVLTTVSLRTLLGLERRAEACCVLVLDDEESEERFGLVVDDVGGVLMTARKDYKPNPSTLDERSMGLFDGTCRTEAGLMVRWNQKRLQRSHLAEAGMFGTAKRDLAGEPR